MRRIAIATGICLSLAISFCGNAQTTEPKDSKTNLLKNSDFSAPTVRSAADGWDSGIWIFEQENRDKFGKEAKNLAAAKIVDTGNGKALELNRSVEVEKLMGNASDKFTLASSQIVKLPDENGGTYRITFDTRSETLGKNRSMQWLIMEFYDGSDPRPGRGKQIRNYFGRKITASPDWKVQQFEMPVPANTRDVKIRFRGDGCGKFQIRNPKFVKVK